MQISIIIPSYNSVDCISDTLSSILRQTFQDFEILVINDGSEDETEKIVSEWMKKEPRIRYFYKPNGGVSSARNVGIEKAKGEYLAFLDSDDTYEPFFLEKMYNQIKEMNTLLCYCGYYHRSGGNILHAFPKKFDFQDVLKFIIEIQWISTDSWLINRKFIEQYHFRFNEKLTYGEDFDFFCRLIYKSGGSYACVNEYLTNYNFREGSLSYKGTLWYSYKFMQGSLESSKSFYDYVCAQQGTQASDYLPLILRRINEMYLRYLWGTFLLGSKSDFDALYQQYQQDYSKFHLDLSLPERKYKIWRWVVNYRMGRMIGKCFFKPYKYLQRRIQIHGIK